MSRPPYQTNTPRKSNRTDPQYQAILSNCFGETLSKAQRAKVKIAEGAIEVLGRCGFAEFRLEAVAKAAGVSRPLILHYFKDSTDLFRFAAQFIRARLHQYILEALSLTQGDRLFSYLDAHFKWLEENPLDARAWLLFYYQASKDASFKRLHAELGEMGRKRIESLIEPLGGKLPQKERTALARDMQALITGTMLIKVSGGGPDTTTAEGLHRSLLKLLRGTNAK